MSDAPPKPLRQLALPCELCGHLVTVHSDRASEYVDKWLEGEITVRCVLHRAPNTREIAR